MHELTATQGILDLAMAQAQAAEARRITDLYLVIGEDAPVTEEAVRFYWQALCPGTPADGARLHFRTTAAAWVCVDCGQRPEGYAGEGCPACGSLRLRPTSGQEFYLEAVELESGDGR
jgi:hydrogenase nickel incorporation protein HypA/HybF